MSTSPFSIPNDSRKAPVNRMIRKLLALRDKALRSSKHLPQFTSHGNPIFISEADQNAELQKYANIRELDKLISQLEQIAY